MFDIAGTRQYLMEFDFKGLFIEQLGWDHHDTAIEVSVDGKSYTLTTIAEKRAMVAFLCSRSDDGPIPDYATRRKIEKQAAKTVHEHIIIYTDGGKSTQVWQWVKRETGRPTACREHAYYRDQLGDSLIQKLRSIAFSLEEEEGLTLVDVTGRTRAAFDLDRVTKRFYDRFKKEHDAFLKFIEGIPDEELLRWYASVMLNRLMFVYFIQKKGFLGNDQDYLRHRLAESREQEQDLFYRGLLCPLFFEGFAKREDERSPEISSQLGKVPYLNGGIFLKHQIEESYGDEIRISDSAFEKLFDFFDQYQWHLDERPLRADNEINPDVLGYIFEKYINQKQMGAYYTKEDITEYIGKNTIVPFLFDAARQKCRIAFEGDQSVWRFLRSDPDRYIYEAVRKGANLPLPEAIAAGLNDVSKRTHWNKPATAEFSLPTEIWREVVARRKRYEEVKAQALGGEITSINDFITYNLNIRQFAQDVIENCEGPELLRAFYHAIEKVTVLDPTCGSGAFLFAALNILEPLYEACLDRMEVFLDELERSGEKYRSDKYGDFKKILKRIDDHPNRRYFILKSIIINNLFGVDIMEEAVEICKLRLFLKLVAQVEEVKKIEPLPDIDFNIRAGNTLVGFATYEDVKKALSSELFAGDILNRVEEHAQEIESYFEMFRQMQTVQGMDSKDFADTKEEVKRLLSALDEELNRYLGEQYGIDVKKVKAYEEWRHSHKPFHWFTEFHSIVEHGGFHIIIGNPPYVEWFNVKGYRLLSGYSTLECGNIYTCICERSYGLLMQAGRFGMIVPISCVATERMAPLRALWHKYKLTTHSSHYSGDAHPSVLFNGVKFRLAILLQKKSDHEVFLSTHFQRWYAEARSLLFSSIQYSLSESGFTRSTLSPKMNQLPHEDILRKLLSVKKTVGSFVESSSAHEVYCHRIVAHFVKAMDFVPYFRSERDGEKKSEDYKVFAAHDQQTKEAFTAVLNSTLFYSWFVTYSDVYHCGREIILGFPVDISILSKKHGDELRHLVGALMNDLHKNCIRRQIPYRATGMVEYDEFYPRLSKPIIDEIDRVLAKHYGFTDEETDFIINYDIKYRMGLSGEVDDDD